jgi:hypothetical protein
MQSPAAELARRLARARLRLRHRHPPHRRPATAARLPPVAGAEGRHELVRILPVDPSTGPVDNSVDRIGTSGASDIGISGVAPSGLRARGPQLTLWSETEISTRNLESNRDSNFSAAAAAEKNACPFPTKRGLEQTDE